MGFELPRHSLDEVHCQASKTGTFVLVTDKQDFSLFGHNANIEFKV